MTGSPAYAQFKKDAFTQQYSPKDSTAKEDTTEKVFSIKEYVRGISHKDKMRIGTMTAGSAICIGGSQIYNKQYWKLPIVYGSIGSLAGLGIYNQVQYNKSANQLDEYLSQKAAWEESGATDPYPGVAPELNVGAQTRAKWFFIGAGICYWATLMDGVVNFDDGRDPHPGKATLYSVLLPGLGQIYNKEYWKVPIYYGGLALAIHFWDTNNANFLRFKRIYIEASEGKPTPYNAETAKSYRDYYRRYRDYSILATAAVYLLQVIDANVFSYMGNFELDDDISMRVEPTVIPNNSYATNNPVSFGMRLGLSF